MNAIVNFNVQMSMTSLEISELVQSRHDKVKQSIERLADRGVVALPPLGEKATAGRPSTFYVFTGEQGKRDSIVVVAQLCPEFTAKLVDRWQALEKTIATPTLPNFNNPAEAARAWADQVEAKQIAEQQVAILEPKAKGLDRIADCTNVLGIREAAKVLKIGQNKLTQYLLDKKVIYRDQSGKLQGYQKSVDQRLIQIVTSAPRLFDSGEKVFTQVKLTQKLITRISAWLEKGVAA